RLPGDHQHHPLRRHLAAADAGVLRRDDDPRGGGDDAFARVQLFQGPGPGALPPRVPHPPALQRDALESQAALEVQPVAALPALPHGQEGFRVHALGQSHLQHVRLAASLLSPPGGLCRDVPGADGRHTLGELRQEERQREVPRLHGPLRVRGDRGRPHVQLPQGLRGNRGGHPHGQAVIRAMSLEGWVPQINDYTSLREVVDYAFDYRGNTTIVTRDGRELVGYIFNRDADAPEPFVQFFDEQGEGPFTLAFADIATIKFTGKDTAAGNSWKAWVERKEKEKALKAAAAAHHRRHVAALSDRGMRFATGALATVAEVAATPGTKAKLREATGAVAVDMESALILRAAAEAGCPGLVLRGVSDDAEDSLSPELAALVTAEGRVRKARAAATVLRQPAIVPKALKLQRATQRALATVADALQWSVDYRAPVEHEPR